MPNLNQFSFVYPHFTFKICIFFLQIKTAFWLCSMKISHLSLSNLNMQWQPRLANWSRIPICVKCDTVVPSTQLRCKSFFHKKSNFWFLNLFFLSKIALLLFYFGLFWGWFYKNLCVIFLSVLCFLSCEKAWRGSKNFVDLAEIWPFFRYTE